MATARPRLGQLLVEAGIVSPEQVTAALLVQQRERRRIGELLVEAGALDEVQLTQVLSQQLSAPWVSLYHIDFSRPLLNLIPREIAEQFCLIPIYVRNIRGQGNTLYVAMDDPANKQALESCARASHMPARAMIAPPSDIRSALRVYYGIPKERSLSVEITPELPEEEPPTGEYEVLGEADEVNDPPPPVREESVSQFEIVVEPTQVAQEVLEPSPAVLSAETDLPFEGLEVIPPSSLRRAPAPTTKTIQVTLLDGTILTLPARTSHQKPRFKRVVEEATTPAAPLKKAPEEVPDSEAPVSDPRDQFTARDLVSALRAVSHGVDASEILGGNVKWEALFAALLSLMLKKQIIADWEFVEEYKKI